MRRILVVEDDLLVAEVIATALDDGYQTTVVSTATEALSALRDGGHALMLLDCTLPGGMDPNLIPEADARGVTVVLMSGDPERVASLSDTPRPSIVKPFSLAVLIDTVEKYCPGAD